MLGCHHAVKALANGRVGNIYSLSTSLGRVWSQISHWLQFDSISVSIHNPDCVVNLFLTSGCLKECVENGRGSPRFWAMVSFIELHSDFRNILHSTSPLISSWLTSVRHTPCLVSLLAPRSSFNEKNKYQSCLQAF